MIGVAVVLVRHGVIDAPAARLTVTSDVPVSVGVSSSAALEVATARALGAGAVEPLRLAALCQEAENQVVGAPCGIMDQVVVAMGRPGAVLPILCRPASVDPVVTLPDGLEVVGVPTGAEHDVSGVPYRRARAAVFMGKRILDDGTRRTARLGERAAGRRRGRHCPKHSTGPSSSTAGDTTDDALTTVDPAETYPVRAATTFGVEEHLRSAKVQDALDPASTSTRSDGRWPRATPGTTRWASAIRPQPQQSTRVLARPGRPRRPFQWRWIRRDRGRGVRARCARRPPRSRSLSLPSPPGRPRPAWVEPARAPALFVRRLP